MQPRTRSGAPAGGQLVRLLASAPSPLTGAVRSRWLGSQLQPLSASSRPACLLPLLPDLLLPRWARMTLVYFLMAVLALLLGIIAVRYTLFAAVWIATGHSFWLFPNLMSDEVRPGARGGVRVGWGGAGRHGVVGSDECRGSRHTPNMPRAAAAGPP